MRNSISVSVSQPVLLTGIFTYTGNDTDLLDETIEVVFDRGTTVLSLYKDNKLVDQAVTTTVLQTGKEGYGLPVAGGHHHH